MSTIYNKESCDRRMKFKTDARNSWRELDMSTGCEGFPESSSYIYGFIDGSMASDSKLQNVLRFLEIYKNKVSQDEKFLREIEKIISDNN